MCVSKFYLLCKLTVKQSFARNAKKHLHSHYGHLQIALLVQQDREFPQARLEVVVEYLRIQHLIFDVVLLLLRRARARIGKVGHVAVKLPIVPVRSVEKLAHLLQRDAKRRSNELIVAQRTVC